MITAPKKGEENLVENDDSDQNAAAKSTEIMRSLQERERTIFRQVRKLLRFGSQWKHSKAPEVLPNSGFAKLNIM